MNAVKQLWEAAPFGLSPAEKQAQFSAALAELTAWHQEWCEPYRNILHALNFTPSAAQPAEQFPFLPVQLFKTMDLCSVPPEQVARLVTSSGTSGQARSKIYLDAATADAQQQALSAIVCNFIGPQRLPMLLIDHPDVLRNGRFTARAAGVAGFSIFSRRRAWALDSELSPDLATIRSFLEEYGNQPFLLFGFTFLVWQLFEALAQLPGDWDFSQGILLHGGGWKSLKQRAVAPEVFRNQLTKRFGLCRIHDYYGMAEQTGSIFMACEQGHLHVSTFSELFVRRADDFSLCDIGEEGILQVQSILPKSYPGHSLLTEDRGVLLGNDGCPCGRRGKYFQVLGRLEFAELRGCSDTYAAEYKGCHLSNRRCSDLGGDAPSNATAVF
ncbi:MAG: acyl-protein synthetase [Anaerotruncus sp.]|nr:acyl-protein synthetase [Anaerotruncus sp.]